jgi:hypothetical protein
VKVKHSVNWTTARRQGGDGIDAIAVPEDHPAHIDKQFVIRCRLPHQLQRFLSEREIGAEVYCPVPLDAELYAP